jgi:integrase
MNEKDVRELEGFLAPRLRSLGGRRQYMYAIGQLGKPLAELRAMNDQELLALLNGKIIEVNPASGEVNRSYDRRYAFKHLLELLARPQLKPYLADVGKRSRRQKRKDLPFHIVKEMVKKANDPQHKLLIMMLSDTGARVSAVINTTKDNIGWDRERAFVVITERKTDTITTKYLSKGTSKMLKSYLDTHKTQGRYLFSFQSRQQAEKIIEKYRPVVETEGRKKEELKVSPHWFRHSKAVALFRKGFNIMEVADLLDHRSLDSTRQYLKASGVSSKEAMERDEPEW